MSPEHETPTGRRWRRARPPRRTPVLARGPAARGPARSSDGAPRSTRSPTFETPPLSAAEPRAGSRVSQSRPTRRSGGRLLARSLFNSSAIQGTAAERRPRLRSGGWSRPSPGAGLTPLPGRQASAGLRPGRRGDIGAGGDPPARAPHRRRPVGRRRHAPPAPVRRSERRRSTDLPDVDPPAEDPARFGQRGGQLRCRHGTDGRCPAPPARTIRIGRDGGAPEARSWWSDRERIRGRNARPVQGVPFIVEESPRPRGRYPPAVRRRVATRPQRGSARANPRREP